MKLSEIVSNFAEWLSGSHYEKEWYACSDCNGSGYYLTADEMARLRGTINYEVVSEILARVPRVV